MKSFTLSPDMLATGQIGVELRAPTYADLRKCRRRFPFDKAERGDRIGYVPDDLLLADLLVHVNGQAIEHNNDLIDRLSYFPLADRQAISAIITETFYIDKMQANEAANIARTKRAEPAHYRDILASDSPSGTFSCRFAVPNSKIQITCETKFPGIEKAGAGLEEYMFAFCLISVNGVDVEEEKDKLGILDQFEIADVQYAANYFIALSTIDEELRVDLKKHSAAIKLQLQSTPVVSTPSSAIGNSTSVVSSVPSLGQ
jgi:hypothetical protein